MDFLGQSGWLRHVGSGSIAVIKMGTKAGRVSSICQERLGNSQVLGVPGGAVTTIGNAAGGKVGRNLRADGKVGVNNMLTVKRLRNCLAHPDVIEWRKCIVHTEIKSIEPGAAEQLQTSVS